MKKCDLRSANSDQIWNNFAEDNLLTVLHIMRILTKHADKLQVFGATIFENDQTELVQSAASYGTP